MQKSALGRFEIELRRWVAAYNLVKDHEANADGLLAVLRKRIGDERLSRIGSAFVNGWLENESEPGRGYFVRETDRERKRGGQYMIIHQGNGKVAPCWELFVQLADYAWLRTVAERHGQTVRLEDDLMDVTVRAGNKLVLYVEQKTKRTMAEKLLEGMRAYGATGFSLNDPDKGNDPLRKAKYIARPTGHPLYLGLSAIGYQQLFSVHYGEGNHFQLVEEDGPISAPLSEPAAIPSDGTPPRSPVDPFAVEIHQLCPNVWVSVGSGRTAYNFYGPGESGDALVVGVYETGEVWTDVSALGEKQVVRLAGSLEALGITLDGDKSWTFWKVGNRKLNLANIDAVKIARAVRGAVSPDG